MLQFSWLLRFRIADGMSRPLGPKVGGVIPAVGQALIRGAAAV